MSLVKNAEDLLLAALTTALPEFAVEAFPERPADYSLLHPLGAVLVQYDGSTFGANQLNGAVAQPRSLRFVVVVIMRNLRDQSGCYDVLSRITQALASLRSPHLVAGATQLSESFLSEAQGVWMYAQVWEFRSVNVWPEKMRNI